jgi:hypothetical protein
MPLKFLCILLVIGCLSAFASSGDSIRAACPEALKSAKGPCPSGTRASCSRPDGTSPAAQEQAIENPEEETGDASCLVLKRILYI